MTNERESSGPSAPSVSGAQNLPLPLTIALLTFVLHSFLVFLYLPAVSFVKYPVAAQMYLNGELSPERLLDFSPLYLYLNVLAQFFPHPILSLEWLQILCTALSTFLLFRLLSNFYNPAVAVAGTVAFALNRTIITYDPVLEPEPLLLLLLLGSALPTLRAGFKNHTIAGLLFGLGILTRPNFLPVVLAIPFHFLFQQKNRKTALRSTACFVIPVLACLLALWIRNTIVLGSFFPFVMNPGTTFFEGNNPNSWGSDAVYPPLLDEAAKSLPGQADYQHEMYRLFARRITGKNLSIREINVYWSSKAWLYLKDNPSHTIHLLVTKIFHALHQYEWHDLSSSYQNEKLLQNSYLPSVPFAMVSAMAVVGIFLQIRAWKSCVFLYALFFCQLAIMGFIYVHARQRLAILFLFIYFACATLQFLCQSRKRLWVLSVIAVLFLLFHFPDDTMREESHLWVSTLSSAQFLNESYRLRAEGKLRRAAQMAVMSLYAAPWLMDTRRPANLPFEPDGFAAGAAKIADEAASPEARTFSMELDRATLLLAAEKPEEAEGLLRKIVNEAHRFKRDFCESSEPYFYLARAAEMRNNRAKAVDLLMRALERSPGDPHVLAHLFALSGQQEYRWKLFRYFDDIDAEFYLGVAFLQTGSAKEAVPSFSYVAIKLPESRRALIYLAAALGESHHFPEGASRYREALAKRPDPVLLEEEIIDIFRNLSAESPRSSYAQYSYGIVLRQFGYYQEALQTQKSALSLDLENKQIFAEIASLEKAASKQLEE